MNGEKNEVIVKCSGCALTGAYCPYNNGKPLGQ